MTKQDDISLLYVCSEIDAKILKEILEEDNIPVLIINDMASSKTAGFGGGFYGSEVKVYVTTDKLEKAKTILEAFKKSINQDPQ